MKCIEILQMAKDVSEDSEDSAECEAALDHIFDFVDNLDVANGNVRIMRMKFF